ncbi:LuxR C-terminal-related transcriptional regulator [Nocardioides sp. SOB77]|uniref:LuxR C-terminal-related transcriptional regulator n=1 Tax=Nocardioides oceani TaxID=3058369 RepID=A0ABT8FMB2_9ACTN|nr:LuxR family transcriptional regulator [Nocardioides oceani]MDN4175674.1 LuxR C-terminal-related transcriptional regulator [Nocardioides oceani]
MGESTRIGVLSGLEIVRSALATLLDDHVVIALDAAPWPADLDLVVFDRYACDNHSAALSAARGRVRLVLLDDLRASGPPHVAHNFATNGVISSVAPIVEIREAILDAARGDIATASDSQSEFDPAFRLSGQESKTLRLVAAGLSNAQIAAEMLISINTVKVYIRQAYRKVGVVRRSQAVAWVYAQQHLAAGETSEAAV